MNLQVGQNSFVKGYWAHWEENRDAKPLKFAGGISRLESEQQPKDPNTAPKYGRCLKSKFGALNFDLRCLPYLGGVFEGYWSHWECSEVWGLGLGNLKPETPNPLNPKDCWGRGGGEGLGLQGISGSLA